MSHCDAGGAGAIHPIRNGPSSMGLKHLINLGGWADPNDRTEPIFYEIHDTAKGGSRKNLQCLVDLCFMK